MILAHQPIAMSRLKRRDTTAQEIVRLMGCERDSYDATPPKMILIQLVAIRGNFELSQESMARAIQMIEMTSPTVRN
jgi:DNA-binding transcriptional regulator YiaG